MAHPASQSTIPVSLGFRKIGQNSSRYRFERGPVIISKPYALLSWGRSTKPRSMGWIHIPRPYLVRWNLQSPGHRNSFGTAFCNLDHETATPFVELDRK